MVVAVAVWPLLALQRSARAPSTAFHFGAIFQVSCAHRPSSWVSPLKTWLRAPAGPLIQFAVAFSTVRSW
ncbi:hypothetical protein D3C72_2012470 [compost metagenome]